MTEAKANNFTFFPDSEEEALLRDASPDDLANAIAEQPDMTGRFIHELLRLDRKEELYQALTTLATRNGFPSLYLTALGGAVTSTAMMITMHGVPESEGKKFVVSTVDMFTRVGLRLPLKEKLQDDIANLVRKDSNKIMTEVRQTVSAYQATLN